MSAAKVNCTGGATLFSNKQLNLPVESTCALKVDILKSIGADVAFNYKEQDVNKVLAEHGPIDM